jgi:hypothetical protein
MKKFLTTFFVIGINGIAFAGAYYPQEVETKNLKYYLLADDH